MPHLLAALLCNAVRGPELDLALSLAAGSFRDATRVSDSAPHFAAGLITDSAKEVRETIDNAVEELAWLRDRLETDADEIVRSFDALEVLAGS